MDGTTLILLTISAMSSLKSSLFQISELQLSVYLTIVFVDEYEDWSIINFRFI